MSCNTCNVTLKMQAMLIMLIKDKKHLEESPLASIIAAALQGVSSVFLAHLDPASLLAKIA